jgi:hypothetical protein
MFRVKSFIYPRRRRLGSGGGRPTVQKKDIFNGIWRSIMTFYRNGTGVRELSLRYNLSEDSIRKILSGMRETIYEAIPNEVTS